MNVGHNTIQLGSDPDPDKNFVIRTPPVQDGTLEIRKGTLEAPGALVATFDGNGNIQQAGRVAFRTYRSTAKALSTSVNTELECTDVAFDYGGGLAQATEGVGRFKAPVSGLYNLTANASPAGSGMTSFLLYFVTPTAHYYAYHASGVTSRANASILVKLNAGDVVYPSVGIEGTGPFTSRAGAGETSFSGFLVEAT